MIVFNTTMTNIIPKRLALKNDPPMLALIYQNTETKKLRRRLIRISEVVHGTTATQLLSSLRKEKRHHEYLDVIPKQQLLKFLGLILEGMFPQGTTILDSINFNGDENLNILGDKDLNNAKEKMNTSFERNKITPDDQDWQYDVEVDFNEDDQKLECGWDSGGGSDVEF